MNETFHKAYLADEASCLDRLREQARLSEKDREVLRMRHEEGWTFAEIGKVLSISTDAARMSWGRAIERLKKQIEKTERFDR